MQADATCFETSPLGLVNPFSSSRIRPGAMPYYFAAGESAAGLFARLACLGGSGEIVGPHGSGKSALLAALRMALLAAGRPVVDIQLCEGEVTPIGPLPKHLPARGMLLIDGWEQLSRWQRWRWRRLGRKHGCGLLATCHQPLVLPLLTITAPDLRLAWQLVQDLQHGFTPRVMQHDVAECFARHHGNVREMLFNLYHRYEYRRRTSINCQLAVGRQEIVN